MTQVNDNLVLIAGESATGKSASLMNLRNQEGVLYLNCEAGKKLPFRNKFDVKVISDPHQVYEAFQYTSKGQPGHGHYHTIVVDTLTFLMDMYESMYVLNAANTQAAWGQFAQFFKNLMQVHVSTSDKNVIFLAHTKEELDNAKMEMKSSVPIKGSLKGNGIEAYFSTVVATKKVALSELEGQDPSLLNITPDDQELEYKHVFQTRLTASTRGERIRSPIGMFARNQTYMDNDAQMLLDHLHAFYN